METISSLKGVGDKTAQLFNRLGVYYVEDLTKFYPRKYDVYQKPETIDNICDEKIYAVSATVVSDCEINNKGRYKVLSLKVRDESGGIMKITWFNMPFLKNSLKKGYRYIFRGEAAVKGSLVFMEQPKIYTFDEYIKKMDTMQPVYPLTAGLSNNTVIKAMKQALNLMQDTKEYLPEDVVKEYNLISSYKAVQNIHFPLNPNELEAARKRLVFDEFFKFSMAVRMAKFSNIENTNTKPIGKSEYSDRVISNLPYTLTKAQSMVYDEIISDMSGKRTMNRLIQGDVGSGKTIVALLAMFDTAAAGYQSILMAPTEVLAKQHYDFFTSTTDANGLPIKCVLLTGHMKTSEKKAALAEIENGNAQIIIGTHAVISENIFFKNPGLVVTDEQHRFGVRQRQLLHKKGDNPHILVMSATPIPRSLALILYGDLDISIINEKPSNRLPIKNCVVDDSFRPNAYRFIEKQINEGHQAYIICAMAKENEDDSIENVVQYSQELKSKFNDHIKIEYLHGKMKASEKNEIMEQFAKGDIKILVSTTVVEVGINVPNATVMMVENAERFGLAGLHQLRGRVGRGKDQSYCIFVSNTKNTLTQKRLNILKDSNDGFYIAEQDLKLRGPGDMFGVRQSGDFGFSIGDIYADADILKMAAHCADNIINQDYGLKNKEHELLKNIIIQYIQNDFNNINI